MPADCLSSQKRFDETLEEDDPERNQVIWEIVPLAVERRMILTHPKTE